MLSHKITIFGELQIRLLFQKQQAAFHPENDWCMNYDVFFETRFTGSILIKSKIYRIKIHMLNVSEYFLLMNIIYLVLLRNTYPYIT